MNKSESIKELATALAKAQGELDHAKKDTNNPFFKSKYADLASVIDAAKKPLADNGLSVCQVCNIAESGEVVLETMLLHSSGEWISGTYPIRPLKTDPQSYGSCLTYARRYCFSAITGIAADDDDGNSASQPAPQKVNKSNFSEVIDYADILNNAKSIDELVKAWAMIPASKHKDFVSIKDAVKIKLSKPKDNMDD